MIPNRQPLLVAMPPKACGDAAGMTLMTETVAPVAKSVPRPRSRKPAIVSASALALRLDCSPAYIGKLSKTKA
jgi:hypothetical protein